MTLDDYLRETDETAEDFAARAGVDPATISRIRHGEVIPKLDTAAAIERASGGKVTMSELFRAWQKQQKAANA